MPRMLEDNRVKWRKAGNMELMYRHFGEQVIACGLGALNPTYDPDQPMSERVVIPIEMAGYIVRYASRGPPHIFIRNLLLFNVFPSHRCYFMNPFTICFKL